MGSISVRGMSEKQLAALKEEASRQGISMNRLVLRRLTHGEEVANPAASIELAGLAGTWSEEEAEAFTTAIAPLEQIDPELWA